MQGCTVHKPKDGIIRAQKQKKAISLFPSYSIINNNTTDSAHFFIITSIINIQGNSDKARSFQSGTGIQSLAFNCLPQEVETIQIDENMKAASRTQETDNIKLQCQHLLVNQIPYTSIVSLIGSVVLMLVLQGVANQQTLNIWLILMVMFNLSRLILVLLYRRPKTPTAKQALYHHMLILLTAAVGISWGVGGVIFMQEGPLPYQVFITLLIGGMMSGAVATYHASLLAYSVFSLPACLPIIFWLFLQTSKIQLAMAAMILVFTVTLWFSARRHYKMLTDSLKLQLEKDNLVEQLKHRSQSIESAHAALLESERKYQNLYDNAPDMYVSIDMQKSIVLQCNQTLLKKLGYNKDNDNITGQSIFNLYHPSCHKEVKETCGSFMHSGEICNAELLLQNREGEAVNIMLNATAVRDENGEVIYCHSNLRDITELKAQEQFETDQQKILNKIIDSNIPLAEILEDVVMAIQRLEPAMTASILLLDDQGKHLHHGAAPDLPAEYCQLIDGSAIGPVAGSCGTAAYRKEQVIVTDIANDPLWADYKTLAENYHLAACWSQPIKDADGSVLGTFAMYYQQPRAPSPREIRLIEQAAALAANVIKRRKKEQELTRLADILQATTDFVGMSDAKGRTIFINRAGRIMMGYGENEDLSGLSITDYHSPDVAQRLQQEIIPVLEKKGVWRGQTNFLCKNGKEIITDQILITHRNDKGEITHYSTIARDISEQIQAEQERATLQSQVEHTQRLESLGVLAGGIAHDFNNILTAILGNAAMAEHKVLTNPQDTQKHLANIVSSSERAAELCKQMLAYSGKGKFVVKALDISAMVEQITRLLEVTIAKNIRIEYQLDEGLPAVEVDAAQIQQVIMNLVMNASDAIGDKTGLISIKTGLMHVDQSYLATTWLSDNLSAGEYVYLEISDTGCGMEQTVQDKLFEPFFTTKFTGHGLGMSAVLGIVRGHQGTIRVSSLPEQGTTFKVLLPVSDKPVQADTSLSDKINNDEAGTGTILVVDDEAAIRDITSQLLQDIGYTTLTAVDGADGIETYRQYQQDIVAVILDMAMPNVDGKTCFTRLQSINPDVKVLLTSGYDELESTTRFAGQGLAGFIQKPYQPETLKARLQSIL